MPVRSDLHEFIQSQPLVDTHEHLVPEAEYFRLKPDILSALFSHYLQHDLICAGARIEADTDRFLVGGADGTPAGDLVAALPAEAAGASAAAGASLETRFRTVEEAWKRSVHTGFGEAARLTAERAYGMTEISAASLKAAEPIHAALLEPGKHLEILRGRDEARRAYESARARGGGGDGGNAVGSGTQREPDPVVGDWALGEAARLCAEQRLPLKIHTGYMAGTGFMDPRWVAPGGLSRLFQAFPDTTFVLMHISYPYWRESIALAKHYPNVYLDMCWAWSIDPHSSRDFVRTFIHTVPAHKLFVFGGDTFLPVAVVGFAEQARRHLARALTAEITGDLLSEREAIDLAARFMHENQYEVFHLAS